MSKKGKKSTLKSRKQKRGQGKQKLAKKTQVGVAK